MSLKSVVFRVQYRHELNDLKKWLTQKVESLEPSEDRIPINTSKVPSIPNAKNIGDSTGNATLITGPNTETEQSQSSKPPTTNKSNLKSSILRYIRVNTEKKMKLAVLYSFVPSIVFFITGWLDLTAHIQVIGPAGSYWMIGVFLFLSGLGIYAVFDTHGIARWRQFGPYLLKESEGTEHNEWIISVKNSFMEGWTQ